MDSLISVIVPIYKVEKYLDRCIESVVNQTYKNLEIVLVDDGSPDNCPQICDEWAKRDLRIKVIHQKNEGVSAARNSGLATLRGDYVMFVDADDWLNLDAVQILYERIIRDNSDIAVGQHVFSFEDGSEKILYSDWMYDTVFDKTSVLKNLGSKNSIPYFVWGKLYKYEVLKNLRFANFLCAEDLYFLFSALGNCKYVSVDNRVIYHYLQNNTSVMHNRNDDVIYDDVTVLMLISKEFLKDKMWEQATYFYTMGVFRSEESNDKKKIKRIIKENFSFMQRLKLLEKRPQIYWRYISIYIPFISRIINAIKNSKKQMFK